MCYTFWVNELKVRVLKTWREKCIGLMGKEKPEAVFFTTRWGIHTFLMKFPIDIIILDDQNTIYFLKKKLLSNKILVWNPIYYRVLELPNGTIEKFGFKKGEKIAVTLF